MTSYCPTCLRHVNGAVCCPGCGALASGLPEVPEPAPRRPATGPRHRAAPASQGAARERRRIRLTLATAAVGLLAAGVVGASGAPRGTASSAEALAAGGIQSLRPDGPHSGVPSLAASPQGVPAAESASPPSRTFPPTAAAAVATAPATAGSLPVVPALPQAAVPNGAAPPAAPPATPTPNAPTSTGTGSLASPTPAPVPTATGGTTTPPAAAPTPAPTAAPTAGSGPDCALRLLVLCLR